MPGVRIELTTPYRRPDLKSGALTTRPTWLYLLFIHLKKIKQPLCFVYYKNYAGIMDLRDFKQNSQLK